MRTEDCKSIFRSNERDSVPICIISLGIRGIKLSVDTEYGDLGKIQYILGSERLPFWISVYTDKAQLTCVIPVEELTAVQEEITEGTGARASLAEEIGSLLFMQRINGQIKILGGMVSQILISGLSLNDYAYCLLKFRLRSDQMYHLFSLCTRH